MFIHPLKQVIASNTLLQAIALQKSYSCKGDRNSSNLSTLI
ncbi:hypothetical protein [Nostoc sp.]